MSDVASSLRAHHPWDVVVVGAGPAGSVAARELARTGCSVLLVDKATFPRRKVCGCCLNENALAVLSRIGLGSLASSLGAVPLTKVQLGSGGRSAIVAVRGVSLSRDAFDLALIQEAVAAGASFLPGVRAVMGNIDGEVRSLTIDGQPIVTKVVIAADGLNGRLAAAADGFDVPAAPTSRIGAGVVVKDATAWYQPGTIYMAAAPAGYVGLVRLEDGRLDLAAAFDAAFVRTSGGLGHAASAVLKHAGFELISGLEDAGWKGTPMLTRRPERIAGERWFAVGDAAGYVEPFTGEGMAWALGAAASVAPIARKAVQHWQPAMAAEWTRCHDKLVGRRQRLCRLTARALRSPPLCRLIVRLAGLVPALAKPLVRALNRPPTWPTGLPV